ncbi:family 20 glycosylhydrolase [Streptomyces sp. CSDS2]|uniref:family 20 glycosylhydrolase n=1 Tax=Streptomyces sp. CSDS2 TaxID=3055051 RepID=UPI0025B10C4E|nr:family 20 glycosylhydrolase [Streptomyces sp. CSDS2]MDN3260860.1 family 20 glycosylhydrolase [Streptomyces sp. CSDS2]
MDVVIPCPAVRTSPAIGGELHLAGPWRIATVDHRLTTVAGTVRALLEPHLGDRLMPPSADDDTPGGGGPGAGPAVLELALDSESSAPHRVPVGVSPRGTAEPADESHRLSVTRRGITCRAATPEGVFRAATTAIQILAASTDRMPCQELSDAPRYAWRGLMVDPARGYLTPGELRRVIDLAALYKLNVLHLHLTDNEGWRLQLPAVPELTADRADSSPVEYYAVDDYRALQDYAADRFVTVIPEIDLPGHCAALRAALPELPAAPAPEGLAGRFPFVPPLDLADPVTKAVVGSILTEVCRLTDGPFVHIGGDEAVGMTADSFVLAVRELRACVRAAGKRPLGWQESSRAGIGEEDIAQYWVDVPMMDLPDTEEELADRPELPAAGHTLDLIRALKAFFAPADGDLARVVDGGGHVLLSPQSHLYLDRPYTPDVIPAGQKGSAARLGFATYRPRGVEHTAAWDPASHGVPDARIAGIEATLFGESIEGLNDLTILLLPRLTSVAETAWSGRAPEWESHRARVARHARLWQDRGLTYLASTEIPWP